MVSLALLLWLLFGYRGGRFPGLAQIKALLGILFSLGLCQLRPVCAFFAPTGEYSLQIYLLKGFALVISRTLICTIAGVTNPAAVIAFNVLIDYGAAYLFVRAICTRFRPLRAIMGMV